MNDKDTRQIIFDLAGIVGAGFVGAKIETAPIYARAPRGLPFVVGSGTKFYPELFPELKAPVVDANGPPLSVADFKRLKKLILHKDEKTQIL